ncbi:TPA: 2-nitropropane dioxygenase [Candidatus Sumerlaeota bacterium]|jgi:nitronate monooxygenase|nr:2-nitropropane dioxygenase [Candidatus Sumerlaeota bacterium]
MNTSDYFPEIIQGGMGAGVSNWKLAKSVACHGQLGVVSGTALDSILARRLQLGDLDGSMRRAMSQFPWQDIVQKILDDYFIEGGKEPHMPFKNIPWHELELSAANVGLLLVSNFVEIFLAKEGHDGPVGINYLEKIQLPTLPSLLGAMLAGVTYVLMGGGIPLAIPGTLDSLAKWEPVQLSLHVDNPTDESSYTMHFDPKQWCPGPLPELTRPKFLAVISSDIVAKTMVRKASGYVDGFVVEDHTAGGHNAPPRRSDVQPAPGACPYGAKDVPDIAKIKNLGRPFWLAGSCASPERLKDALAQGAAGIQVGTIFAFCEESGITPELKQQALRKCLEGTPDVCTNMNASPTGYPFKILQLEGTLGDPAVVAARKRVCDLGFLRQFYITDEGKLGYRCTAEPEALFVKKGGKIEKTEGALCLCNGLLGTIGLGQTRKDYVEPAVVTTGEDFAFVEKLVKSDTLTYTAKDAIDYLKS